MSSLWILERESKEAGPSGPSYWLLPGFCRVGRQPPAEVLVAGDKSISRVHAEITVPQLEEWEAAGGRPYIRLKDLSKYGIKSTSPEDREEKKLTDGRVGDEAVVKFGHTAKFRLRNQQWRVFISPQQLQDAPVGLVEQLKSAAAEAGLPVTDQLQPEGGAGEQPHAGTHSVVLTPGSVRADGAVVLALLQRQPLVAANWLLQWPQRKVWQQGEQPEAGSYPVQVHFFAAVGGGRKALAGTGRLHEAQEQRLLAGQALLWTKAASDPFLRAATELLGATNGNAPSATRAKPAAGSVLVKATAEEQVSAACSRLPWTTLDLLMAGMLEGSLDGVVQAGPASPAATPASAATKGKGKKKKGAQKAPATSSKRRRAAKEEETGSDTDAAADTSSARETGPRAQEDARAAAGTAEMAQPAAAAAAHAAAAPAAAPAPVDSKATAGGTQGRGAAGTKNGQDGGEASSWQQRANGKRHEEAGEQGEQATPAKRQRKGRGPAAVPPPAASPAAAAPAAPAAQTPARAAPPAACRPAVELPAAEGWHAAKHRGAVSPPVPASTSPAATEPVQVMDTLGAPASDASEAATKRRGGAQAEAVEEGKVPALIVFRPLIAVGLGPGSKAGMSQGATAGDNGLPNFKAFRRNKGAGGGATAPVAVVPFCAQPYQESLVDGDAYLKAEAERRRMRVEADDLFTANLKAKKAKARASPEEDTPPKGKGRGCGSAAAKKNAAAAAGDASQRSMLNFLSGGRGRGRGRGK